MQLVVHGGKLGQGEALGSEPDPWNSGEENDNYMEEFMIVSPHFSIFFFSYQFSYTIWRSSAGLITVVGTKYFSPSKEAGQATLKVKSYVSDEYLEIVERAALH